MRPEIIVHLGSGLCSELDDYATSAEKVVLVEAQPDIAAQLRDSAANYANVEVICGAVRKDDCGGTAPFAVFNVSEVSGFCPPGALKAMLPRLSEVRKIDAGLMDLNSVLGRYQTLGLPYRIIVDVNGLEGEIIEALAEPDSGYFVSDIRVHCGLHALYEGGLSAAEVESRLLESGFRDVVSEGSGPVRTVRGHRSLAVYIDTLIERERTSLRALQQSSAQAYAGALEQVDLLTAELESLRAEGEASRSALESQLAERLTERDMARERERANFEALENAKRQLADKEAELASLRAEGEASRSALESQLADKEAELASLRAEGEASRSALESQLADKEAELASLRSEGEAARSELEGQLAERLAERDTAREREKANFQALENAKRQVQATESELERLRTALASSERNVEDRQNENKRLQQELDTAREDLRLSLRIQRLAQADLAELQQRYAESVSQRADIENQISGLIEHFQLEDARKSALAEKPALPAGQNRRPVNKTKSRSAKGK